MTQDFKTSHDIIVAFICNELEAALPDPLSLSAETDMTKDIAVDSIATMDLVFALEEKFDISVPLNALADICKIGELADLIEKLQNERQKRA